MAKKSQELAKLIPESLTVKKDGRDVVLAGNAAENKILNWLLAAEIRSFLETAIQKYNADDSTPTPKELRDLVAAAKELSEFSAAVYKEEEKGAPTVVTPDAPIDVNFDSLKKKTDDDTSMSADSPRPQ
jgi:hypothetical protein